MPACILSHFSCVQFFVTLWTVAHQAPLSTGFSRQKYWSGVECTPPGDLHKPGIKPTSPVSPALQADSLPLSHPQSPLPHLIDTSPVISKVMNVPGSNMGFSNSFYSLLGRLSTQLPAILFYFSDSIRPQRYANTHPWTLEIRLYAEKGSLQMRLSERF